MQKDLTYYTLMDSPVGELRIISDGYHITELWGETSRSLPASFKDTVRQDELPILKEARAWLSDYFNGDRPDIDDLPLKPAGTEYLLAACEVMKGIAYGETISYKEVAIRTAKLLSRKSYSARAAGGAVGHNPISIIIPCHRVVGSGGSLTGYGGGLAMKMWLLRHEGVDLSLFTVPTEGTAL